MPGCVAAANDTVGVVARLHAYGTRHSLWLMSHSLEDLSCAASRAIFAETAAVAFSDRFAASCVQLTIRPRG